MRGSFDQEQFVLALGAAQQLTSMCIPRIDAMMDGVAFSNADLPVSRATGTIGEVLPKIR